jgi:proline iminopeptidase
MAEMLRCALETLSGCGVQGKVDVIGHSMGSLCALGLAVEHPEAVRRLVLVGGMAGFPAVIRWGMPGSVWKWNEPEFWQCMSWGLRLRYGRGSLALHKRLSNLMARPCFFNKSLFAPLPLHPEDHARGVPIRYLWLRNLGWKLDYASRLGQVGCPTLICAGRHDPETPLPCSEQLRRGIPGSRLTLFEHSGHAPFLEEPELFARSVARFLSE